MSDFRPEFWRTASESEKRAIATLGAIFIGIMLFVSGLVIGEAIGALL